MLKTSEYDTEEYEKNRSTYSVLKEQSFAKRSSFTITYYHRTAGYKPSGSLGVWTEEGWGYKITEAYGSSMSHFFAKKEDCENGIRKVLASRDIIDSSVIIG